jgi:asparagine synthase (glutamine-hydrolysing)
MCGIAGCLSITGGTPPDLASRLTRMSRLIAHRGPDGQGGWIHPRGHVGLAHRRLAIIDLDTGHQPMTDGSGNWIVFNGEIYNYLELRAQLGPTHLRTTSDTEVILRAYERWGTACLDRLRGMFAFALWDEARGRLFCARDRFGMKPFYYATVDGTFHFASEAKALLPFLPGIETDPDALKDYLAFQACLDGKTLFRGIRELPAAHELLVGPGEPRIRRYWNVEFNLDFDRSPASFDEELRARMIDSVDVHLRADVPVGTYLSGGLDSSIVASLAADLRPGQLPGFVGSFPLGPEYDERPYAREVAASKAMELHEVSITVDDFIEHIGRVIYHLDYPAAGPGSFSQYMVSELAARHRKVVLGGQGGDEMFGGYTRYLVAYLEQCLKGAIDGTMHDGNFIVSYESILPNLTALRSYKPMLQEFWREGMFEDMDRRYFRLINRAPDLTSEIRWDRLGDYSPFETFRTIFNADNITGAAYLDRMTHFDFKALLPALLQVEDRVSMAHGLESRLPYLDHPLVELAATIPPGIKFAGGRMKRAVLSALGDTVPPSIAARRDKMGFPTPFNIWARGDAHSFVMDIMTSRRALERDLVDNRRVVEQIETGSAYGRNFWGLFSLELWQQTFHDQAARYRAGPDAGLPDDPFSTQTGGA